MNTPPPHRPRWLAATRPAVRGDQEARLPALSPAPSPDRVPEGRSGARRRRRIAPDVRSFHPNRVLAALFLANDVYGMLQGPQSSKIAHSAHLGGALFGAVWVGLRLFLR